jgi:hypothetical protein
MMRRVNFEAAQMLDLVRDGDVFTLTMTAGENR